MLSLNYHVSISTEVDSNIFYGNAFTVTLSVYLVMLTEQSSIKSITSSSFVAFTSPPFSIKNFAISLCPIRTATYSGVY